MWKITLAFYICIYKHMIPVALYNCFVRNVSYCLSIMLLHEGCKIQHWKSNKLSVHNDFHKNWKECLCFIYCVLPKM